MEVAMKVGDVVAASYWTGGGFTWVVGVVEDSEDGLIVQPFYMCGEPGCTNPIEGAHEIRRMEVN